MNTEVSHSVSEADTDKQQSAVVALWNDSKIFVCPGLNRARTAPHFSVTSYGYTWFPGSEFHAI